MKIELRGVSLPPALGTRIQNRLGRELGRIHAAPLTAVVTFTDDNGPKGGRALHCAVTIRVPRRPAIRVEDVAETAWLAFDRSFGSLKRELAEYRERSVERTRYPKKYFAAKRLVSE